MVHLRGGRVHADELVDRVVADVRMVLGHVEELEVDVAESCDGIPVYRDMEVLDLIGIFSGQGLADIKEEERVRAGRRDEDSVLRGFDIHIVGGVDRRHKVKIAGIDAALGGLRSRIDDILRLYVGGGERLHALKGA